MDGTDMGSLVFQCPTTGQAIESGIRTDSDSLAQIRWLPVKLFCPCCRTVHVMRAQDGRLADKSRSEAEILPRLAS